MKLRKAVIPVAGLGTRFLPATKAVPKELLPIVDRPSIHYIIEELVQSGIQEIILVMGRGKQGILNYFDRDLELEDFLRKKKKEELLEQIRRLASMVELVTVWQFEPLGLGHAILCADDVVGEEPFLVCLPDDLIDSEVPCVKQMMRVYEEKKASVIAVETVPIDQVYQYGIIDIQSSEKNLHQIKTLVEKPDPTEAPSQLGVVGRYLLSPNIFNFLKETQPGAAGEIQLTDALNAYAKHEVLYGFEFAGQRFDTGDKLGFLKANLNYGLKRPGFREQLQEFIGQIGIVGK